MKEQEAVGNENSELQAKFLKRWKERKIKEEREKE